MILRMIFVIILKLSPIALASIQSEAPPCSDLALPKDYDVMKAPSNSVHVSFQQTVFNVAKLNFQEQTFVLKLRIVLDWTDARLSKSTTLSDYDYGRLNARYYGCFWRPYFRTVVLAGEEEMESNENFFFTHTLGKLQLIRRYKYLVACPMRMKLYPMDIQVCSIAFVSWKMDSVILDWSNTQMFNDTMRSESAYDVEIRKQNNCNYNIRQNSCLKLTLTFRRRLGMYLMTVYFPSSLIVIVSFVSFWIDPLSVPGRVTLTITSLLALMTQFISVRNPLRDVNHVTAMDIWFMGCIFQVALTMFEFAANHFLARFNSTDAKPEESFMDAPEIVRVEAISKHNLKTVWTPIRIKIKLGLRKLRRRLLYTNYDAISRTMFPVMFIAYTIVYWVTLVCFLSQ